MPHRNMKDDVIIGSISMVLMAIPVAGSDVNLDIPSRQTKSVSNDCIPKVGTAISVDSARVDYFEWLVSCRGESDPDRLLPHQCRLLFRGFYPIACNHAQKKSHIGSTHSVSLAL